MLRTFALRVVWWTIVLAIGAGASSPAPASGLDNLPFMIGDGGPGPTVGFTGLLQADLSHSTLGASRLSVADDNTVLPVNRLRYSYRHLASASGASFYGFADSVDLDRHLIGWERTFWDRSASVELRLPIEDRLNSKFASRFDPQGAGIEPIVGVGGDSLHQTELGNISAIFKYVLWEIPDAAVSAGLGVGLPTARDVEYVAAINGETTFPSDPGLSGFTQGGFLTVFNNETVYLNPFLAWAVRPAPKWFHQGFLQVDLAANPSRVLFQGGASTVFLDNGNPIGLYQYFTLLPVPAQYTPQTLMRINLSGGRMLVDAPQSRGLRQLALIGEMHYTTALNDAHRSDLPLAVSAAAGTIPLPTIEVGGLRNGVNFLNAVAGVSADYAGWTVVNGVIVPIRDSPDRAFDFQYNVQVQRPF